MGLFKKKKEESEQDSNIQNKDDDEQNVAQNNINSLNTQNLTQNQEFVHLIKQEKTKFHTKWLVGWIVAIIFIAYDACCIAFAVTNKIPWESGFSCIAPTLIAIYLIFSNIPFLIPKKFDNLKLQNLYTHLLKSHCNTIWLFWISLIFGIILALGIWTAATLNYDLINNLSIQDSLQKFLSPQIWSTQHHLYLILLIIGVCISVCCLLFFGINTFVIKKRLHQIANYLPSTNVEVDSLLISRQNKRNLIKLIVFILFVLLPLLFILLFKKKVTGK